MNAARKTAAAWKVFTYADPEYQYAGTKLKAAWPRLHQGDAEPFPDKHELGELIRDFDAGESDVQQPGGDLQALATQLQQAWRLYHEGEFGEAVALGESLGVAGFCVANKASAIYAHYLETNAARKLQLLKQVAERAQQAGEALPHHANSHYLRAYALGRYSQGYSVIKALAEGIGTQVKDCLDRTLKLQPKHAEAHTALATWHAEIIDKVGRLIGGLTYGANADTAIVHYRKALALSPHSAIARVEYADGLLKLFGSSRQKEAQRLYEEAADQDPVDAMERLDVELAKSRLKE